MIIKIQKGAYFKGVINYNEKKVNEGVAELIDKNILSETKNEYIQEFNEVSSLNAKLNKNKCVHFAVSLAPEDKLSSEAFRELAQDILSEMGYQNSPFLVYRHHDTLHQHIHIVTSRVDFDGKTVSESNDVYRGIQLERKLENKYGLQVISPEGSKAKSLEEINAEKYSFYNGYVKAQSLNIETGIFLQSKKAIPNQKIIETIGIDKYQELYENLLSHNLIYQTDKNRLLNTLQTHRVTSNSYEQFISRLQAQGIEPREVLRKDKKIIAFKTSNGLYLEESKLPEELHLKELKLLSSKPRQEYNPSTQLPEVKNHLAKIIRRTSQKARSLDDFMAMCRINNIEVKTHQNSGGIYGISFISKGTEYKASSLDRELSWNKLQEQFKTNNAALTSRSKESKNAPEKATKPSNTTSPKVGRLLSDQSEEKEQERLRKKYNRDSTNEEGMEQ